MSSMQQVLAAGPPISVKRPPRRPGHCHLRGSDFRWAIAFVLPYAAVFFVFVVYPFGYALWMASKPSLYADLVVDQFYLPTVVNTLLFVGLGVNVKMFVALLLSGFFIRRRWWIRPLLAVYVLPWVIAAEQACVSFHWMLQQEGLVDGVLSALFGIDGPIWFNNRWLALGANILVLHLEMDAVLDRNIPRCADEDPSRHLRFRRRLILPTRPMPTFQLWKVTSCGSSSSCCKPGPARRQPDLHCESLARRYPG